MLARPGRAQPRTPPCRLPSGRRIDGFARCCVARQALMNTHWERLCCSKGLHRLGCHCPRSLPPELPSWEPTFLNTCQEPDLGAESPTSPEWPTPWATLLTNPGCPGGPQRLDSPPRLEAQSSPRLPRSGAGNTGPTPSMSLAHRELNSPRPHSPAAKTSERRIPGDPRPPARTDSPTTSKWRLRPRSLFVR